MTRKMNKTSATASPQETSKQFTWRTLGVFWLLSLLLLLSSLSLPDETVTVLDGRHETALLTQSQWIVPAIQWEPIDTLAQLPHWIFALAGSFLIALLGWRHLQTFPISVILLAIIGLSLEMQPENLIQGIILLGFIYALDQQTLPGRKLLVLGGGMAISILLTIEFGYVAIYCLLLLLPGLFRHYSWKLGAGILAAGLIFLVAGIQFPSWLSTALRPISWISVPNIIDLLPSSASLINNGHVTLGNFLLVLLLGYCLWKTVTDQESFHYPLLLIPLGIACGHYLWLCAFSIAVGIKPNQSIIPSARINHLVLLGSLLFGGVYFSVNTSLTLGFILRDSSSGRFVDPARWSTRGRVMLMDLEQSKDWQTQSLQRKYTLLLDDRWETGGVLYRKYAGFRRDLNEGRADSYLLSDDSWGGYKRELKAWAPSLLVTNSNNLHDIRRLSLSPHWSLLGIDSRKTIFGYQKDKSNRSQSQLAYSLLTHLEWPQGKNGIFPRKHFRCNHMGRVITGFESTVRDPVPLCCLEIFTTSRQ
ncbi:MAG: hypothetical protein JKY95_12465 [Planctomycetaceae bacterium]|nr:hypothetical protein [Planctomycetaceae bacterium]